MSWNSCGRDRAHRRVARHRSRHAPARPPLLEAPASVLGMLLLGVTGVLVAMAWQRRGGSLAWAGWPLGLAVVALPPQFYLPPEGRMLFGLGYAVAAAVLAVAAWRAGERDRRVD